MQHAREYLRSRILATPCSKGCVTLVSVYLEPGLKASGLVVWLLEALAGCYLGFEGPWIDMGDWNMEPAELAQASWVATSLVARCSPQRR